MEQRITSNDVTFSVHIDSDIERARLSTFDEKEPETLEWIRSFMSSKDVFVDVGANIGLYTLYAAAVHRGIRVSAFEPACNNFYKLCKNVALNQFHSRVMVGGFGLGDGDSVARLTLSTLENGSASHALGNQRAQKEHVAENFSHLTPVMSLDSLVVRGVVAAPNHVKIDVDGTERAVIAGMRETLGNDSLRSVLLELDHELSDANEIMAVMNEAGFTNGHPINQMPRHSRERRTAQGNAHIENVIFTRSVS